MGMLAAEREGRTAMAGVGGPVDSLKIPVDSGVNR